MWTDNFLALGASLDFILDLAYREEREKRPVRHACEGKTLPLNSDGKWNDFYILVRGKVRILKKVLIARLGI